MRRNVRSLFCGPAGTVSRTSSSQTFGRLEFFNGQGFTTGTGRFSPGPSGERRIGFICGHALNYVQRASFGSATQHFRFTLSRAERSARPVRHA